MSDELSKFTLKFTADERDMLEQLAEADGRSAAGWIRHVIRREHAKLAPAPKSKGKGKR